MSGKPISVDAAGNGLYALPGGGFAFVDFESPEERYCRSFGDEFDPGELEREQYELGLIREFERDSWWPDEDHPWREREEPMGSMEGFTLEECRVAACAAPAPGSGEGES